jgi:hypothetical protein
MQSSVSAVKLICNFFLTNKNYKTAHLSSYADVAEAIIIIIIIIIIEDIIVTRVTF